MKNEIQTLEDNKTWELVDLPKAKTAIGIGGSTRLSIIQVVKWKYSRLGW